MFKKSMSIVARTAPALLMVAAIALVGMTSVSAQVDESETCASVDFGGTRLIRKVQKVVEFTPIAAIDIPAGPVTIPRATSTDVYDNRINVTQLSEIWEVQFIGADGSVIATSGLTEDLPDRVVSGFWEGPITGVTLPVPAVGIRAHHRPEFTTFDTPESVRASGVELCFPTQVTTTPPTTQPPTTEPPTTQPPTTEPPTTQPPTTVCDSTTTTGPDESTTTTDPDGPSTTPPDPCGPTTSTTPPTTVCDSTTTTDPDDSTSTTDPDGPSTTPPDPCGPTSSTTSTTMGTTSTTRPVVVSSTPVPPTLVVVGSETGALVFPAALMLLAGIGLVLVSKRPA